MDSEFFAAAFYLGACYAAGGKDREAAGAWQTSLITESNAPFVYTLLGDALLRLREHRPGHRHPDRGAHAVARRRQVGLRLGTALVMANKPADALKVLEPYLAAHPADHERLFLALRALYEARSAGRVHRHRRGRQGPVHPLRRRLRRRERTAAGAGGPVAQIHSKSEPV